MTAPTIHATAIVIGTTGVLFVGASGSGKSSTALACICAARQRGLFASLVADDRVVVTRAGNSLIARAPHAIKGLAELRGFGIIPVTPLAAARLSLAIRPLLPPFGERMAPEEEVFPVAGASLPLAVLPLLHGVEPLDLLLAIMPLKCSKS